MPIALVVTDLDVGGAEKALVALATGVDRRRWSPAVYCLSREGELVEPLRAAGVPVACLGVQSRRPLRAVFQLAKALRVQRPLLVQSFLFHANLAARFAAPLAGRPWVLAGIRVAEREKRWHRSLERLTSRMVAGSVCVSQGVFDFSRDVTKLPADRLTIIPNGIDADSYDTALPVPPEELGLSEQSRIALYAGRMTAQKGVRVLLEAFSRIAFNNEDWQLLLAGDGPDYHSLRAFAATMPRVHWIGRRSDVSRLLKSCDLFVLPSIWEGMPNVVLEAMAAGRAVVATDVEGSRELVVPWPNAGATGWLAPAGNVEALCRVLNEAMSDPERLRILGEQGRTRVGKHFTQARVVESYETLWASVLGFEPANPDSAPRSRLIE